MYVLSCYLTWYGNKYINIYNMTTWQNKDILNQYYNFNVFGEQN